jgi:hypothetical protein
MTPFQQALIDAANFMIQCETLSGIAIKESRERFMALVERAVDANETPPLCMQPGCNEKRSHYHYTQI